MKFEKALVTGGAGFIGSHLVEELLKHNVKVLVVDNLLTGKKSNIDKLDNVETIYDDLGSDASLMACLLYTSPSPRDRTRSRMPSSA